MAPRMTSEAKPSVAMSSLQLCRSQPPKNTAQPTQLQDSRREPERGCAAEETARREPMHLRPGDEDESREQGEG